MSQITADQPTAALWLFNAETARANAAKSVAARKRKAELAQARIKADEDALLAAQAIASVPPSEENQSDTFRRERLNVVRDEIKRLDALAATKTDPKELRDIYAAINVATERERRLANRSLPPTIRANGSTRRQRGSQSDGPGFRAPEVLPDPPAKSSGESPA